MAMVAAPLEGIDVVVRAAGVAAAYAGRMLGTLGAKVTLVEPPGGSPLRREPPFLPHGSDGGGDEGSDEGSDGGGTSALFAYLAAGMTSVFVELESETERDTFTAHLARADIFIDDTPIADRARIGLDPPGVADRQPQLIHVSVLPFGSDGPKSGWKGGDLVIQHAGGEGNLLPNGLAVEMFPDRPPLKIGGHFGAMQGGVAAALGALSALWARPTSGGQYVDVSSQDANLAVGAFAIQRLGDGSVEHRVERSFRYGGVIPCADGYLELLTLEQRQWDGLVELLGRPEWALDPAFSDSVERSRRGTEINRHIRAWASVRKVDDIVAAGQRLNVPLARYKTPHDILSDPQERHRGLFQAVPVPGSGTLDVLVSPFHIDGQALHLRRGPPPLRDVHDNAILSAQA